MTRGNARNYSKRMSIHIKTASEVSTASSNNDSLPYYYVESPMEPDIGPEHSGSVHHLRDLSASTVHPWDDHVQGGSWESIRLENLAKIIGGGRRGSAVEYVNAKWCDFGPTNRLTIWVVVVVVVLLLVGLGVLLGLGHSYKPYILVQEMKLIDMNIQQGVDRTGVATEMISLNSTVRILHRKPATLFAIHVSATSFILDHNGLKLASGQMNELHQSRNRETKTTMVIVQGDEMPLYGVYRTIRDGTTAGKNVMHSAKVKIGLNLTFTMRWKIQTLGKLANLKFVTSIRCPFILDGALLGKPINLVHSCIYQRGMRI